MSLLVIGLKFLSPRFRYETMVEGGSVCINCRND